ncbi:conserved hypothetical protein [Trichinella spiralis]|nr:conserved hypothetical protein [Trichinella spiralis]
MSWIVTFCYKRILSIILSMLLIIFSFITWQSFN